MGKVQCPYCQKILKSQRGLEQHIKSSAYCQGVRADLKAMDTGGAEAANKEVSNSGRMHLQEEDSDDESSDDEYVARTMKFRKAAPKDTVQMDKTIAWMREQWLGLKNPPQVQDDSVAGLDSDEPQSDEEDNIFDPFSVVSSDEEDDGAEPAEDGNQDQQTKNKRPANQKTNREWEKYLKRAFIDFMPLSEKEQCAVRIIHKLVKKRATLDTYEAVMEWHLRESGKLLPHESLGKSKHFVSRQTLMKKLKQRYHMAHQYAKPHRLILPHSKTKLQVWKKRAHDNVLSLLTDPRWFDEDWLYFDDDPFAPPPEDLSYIRDINTGEAYRETYKKLITKPNQILVAVPLYIDGAVTGQYDKLQVTALKMSIGILNRRARDKEYAWKSLGYVTNYTKEDSRGKKIFVESGHVAAHEQYMVSDDEEGEDTDEPDVDMDVDKAADYHAILEVLLESLADLCKEGMVVDIFYKGKRYPQCELVFFIPFVKCDGDEGDKLCCLYRSRSKGQQSLCRYCTCPNDDTDNQDANWAYKTEPMLQHLLDNENLERLRELSQIGIDNCFHGLQFGLHNDRGIHGACPWELLHAILLGIFKYVRDCLFAQVGKDSKTAEEVNALAQMYGALFARQSDRDKPRTKFGKGILKGKLMAKEYSGVLLVMAVLLRSKSGQDILKSARRKNFRETWQVDDWTLLVETLLQWEAYLNLDQMELKHVQRLKRKHRFIMFLLKKVGNRTAGMGWKVMKFHAILHLAFDILMFGVPMTVDTGSNESHHKTTKVAAKLTQKDIKTFEEQTSNRMDDFHVLDLAIEELDGRALWDYFQGHEHKIKTKKVISKSTGGMRFKVTMEEGETAPSFFVLSRMKGKDDLYMDNQYLAYCWDLQKKLAHLIPTMLISSEHCRDGVMFRAHPNYRGKGVWRDWVMIQWEEGEFPAHIWGFVDLSGMDAQEEVELEDGTVVEAGVWAIVESSNYHEDSSGSDIFRPLKLDLGDLDDDGVRLRKFYLVDVETFKDPIVVVPNIGTTFEYLLMAPRSQWAQDFISWIDSPHKYDKTEMLPEPAEEEEDG